MKDLDKENFDIDSANENEFETGTFKNIEVDLEVSANFEEKVESQISWKEAEGSVAITVWPFSGKVRLKVNASNFKKEDVVKRTYPELISTLSKTKNIKRSFGLTNQRHADDPTSVRLMLEEMSEFVTDVNFKGAYYRNRRY
ncbi:hypothetical protein TNCV_2164451 [Trichonephila clavipes]|nr:hypothetical protein TNCV_2164451 [Trichonephila clavipes]